MANHQHVPEVVPRRAVNASSARPRSGTSQSHEPCCRFIKFEDAGALRWAFPPSRGTSHVEWRAQEHVYRTPEAHLRCCTTDACRHCPNRACHGASREFTDHRGTHTDVTGCAQQHRRLRPGPGCYPRPGAGRADESERGGAGRWQRRDTEPAGAGCAWDLTPGQGALDGSGRGFRHAGSSAWYPRSSAWFPRSSAWFPRSSPGRRRSSRPVPGPRVSRLVCDSTREPLTSLRRPAPGHSWRPRRSRLRPLSGCAAGVLRSLPRLRLGVELAGVHGALASGVGVPASGAPLSA